MVVQMDLPELGLTGEAIVTDIQAAPEIEPLNGSQDDRRIVTATFHHSSGDVIDLVFADGVSSAEDWKSFSETPASTTSDEDGERLPTLSAASDRGLTAETQTLKPVGAAETIGTTSNHPFWSVDRQEYVQAGSLERGERLKTLHGHTKVVVSNLPRPGPKTDVYNLEVHAEHVYFVGEDGVLVHNAGPEYVRNHDRFVRELSDARLTGNRAKKILSKIENNFTEWDSVRIYRTTRERSFWRRWGGANADGSVGAAGRRGQWGTVGPRSKSYTLETVAVIPDFGGGDLSKLSRWRLKKGILLIEGPAGPQVSSMLGRTVDGGGHQLYVPDAFGGALIKPRTVQ